MARSGRRRLIFTGRAVRVHAYHVARPLGRASIGSLALGVLLGAFGSVLPWSVAVVPMMLAGIGVFLFLLLLMLALFAWVGAAWGSSWRPAAVRVTDALEIAQGARRLSVPVLSIVDAHLSPASDCIKLTTERGVVVSISLETLDEVDQLLDAIAAAGSRATWRARVYLRAKPWVSKVVAVAAGGVIASLSCILAGSVMAVSLGVMSGISVWVLAVIAGWPRLRGEVVVGRDGVAIRCGREERFLPLRRIAGVRAREAWTELSLTSGGWIEMLVAPPWRARARGALGGLLAERRRNRFAALVRWHAERSGHGQGSSAEQLGRQGRPLKAWQEALQALVREEAAGYRGAAVPEERALEVLEDGGAPVELRVGAALALSGDREREAARRARRAIEGCASQEVRAALEQAAEGELEEGMLERARAAAGER